LYSISRALLLLQFLSFFLLGLYGQKDTARLAKTDSAYIDRIDLSLTIPDTIEIGEAVILPFKTYNEFRRAFVNLDTQSGAKITAKKNMSIIQDLIIKGAGPEMNSYENYRNRYTYNLLRPGGIIIFSTNPRQGVTPLIKKALGKD
jgi:hypothetical protein